ncbi:hypothetical protein DYB36_006711, partial [Aphanomyces astaci]
DYVVTARIGSGSFAIVYKGYHKVTNVPVAVKAINKTKLNPKLLENLESEISIMRQINHPNIVKLYDIKKTDKHIYLMLEYCDGGDLQHFIKKQPNGVVTEATARHFLRELADGLHVLWSLNLIHRDLKPQNLLLTEPSATSSLKIADFGFARHLESTSLAETLCGSPLYMAPEILQFQKYDNKADLWSVGTILYEMVVGRPPFNGANQVQLLHNIQRENVRFPKDLPVGRDAVALMEGLLVRDPKRRISFDQFFHAPFLDRPPPSSAMLLCTFCLTLLSLQQCTASSTSSSILKTSVPVPPPLLLPSPSSQLPVSPDLVPISMSSLRINPFKTDLAASTSSAMLTDMVERVQAILSIVDVIMQRSRAAADACGGLMHPSGTSSVSSSANSSPASSVVGPDNGRVATRHHLVPSCPEHALMLVMKGLRLLHMVADGQISANNQGRIKAVLIQCIDKAEQCTYDERSGVEGGGGKSRLAGDLYGRALLLLESVLIASASTLHPDDRLRLVQFWHAFRQRLGQCRDDDVAACPSDTNDQST